MIKCCCTTRKKIHGKNSECIIGLPKTLFAIMKEIGFPWIKKKNQIFGDNVIFLRKSHSTMNTKFKNNFERKKS